MSLTLEQITKIEPRVDELLRDARNHDGGQLWHHYSACKKRLRQLVGWDAKRPELRTIEAFNVVQAALVVRIDALEAMQELQGARR